MIRVDSPKYSADFTALAHHAYKLLSLSGNASVEIDFLSDKEIRALNSRARGVDSVTDVLSFPALNEIKPFTRENYPFDCDPDSTEVLLGSIAVCETRAREQAQEYGHSFEREICYLFVHGLLHLLGYDHETESDRAAMRDVEESVLAAQNITRGEL